MNGKGDTQRPMQVTAKEYADNWQKIFKGKKLKEPSLKEAARKLNDAITKNGRPNWLTSIGVGSDQIYLYVNALHKDAIQFRDKEFEGFPVVVRRMGKISPLGNER